MARARHVPDLFRRVGELGHLRIDHRVIWHRIAQGIHDRQNVWELRAYFTAPLYAGLSDSICGPIRGLSCITKFQSQQAHETRRISQYTLGGTHIRGQRLLARVHADHFRCVTQMFAPDDNFGQLRSDHENQISLADNTGTIRTRQKGAKMQWVVERHNPTPGEGAKCGRIGPL
ncbi:hypothetical protein OCA8868_01470 [Octadecabacter ascidiaceicola]|uniref:Uncharacterized protein n=1 Tax=Octadecabacter ascidiaceicola TaxID=1655543 RepID=A0A238K5W7_9RHOB|nr:hypothetical protein OCA8868_01470 [Octadecabacter ascidiaceicola]